MSHTGRFFQVYEPLGGASGNPGSASTTAAMSSSVAHLDSVINSPQTDQEGSYIVPTPESGDLNFNEDDFDLTSILSEAKEAYSLEFRTGPVKTEKTSADTQGAESGREETSFQFDQQQGENQTLQDSTRDEVDCSLIIITDHATKIHECLNRSFSNLITDESLKGTLVEAGAILGQHGVAQAVTLQRFLEDLYECDKKREVVSKKFEASNKEVQDEEAILAICKASIDQVTPVLNTGIGKEEGAIKAEQVLREEIKSLEQRLADARSSLLSTKEGLLRVKISNARLRASLSSLETKQASAKTSRHCPSGTGRSRSVIASWWRCRRCSLVTEGDLSRLNPILDRPIYGENECSSHSKLTPSCTRSWGLLCRLKEQTRWLTSLLTISR
ncbi:hypothetical protein PIB30_046435 [Stylosanthes scabra]|uniref:Uncharacterized protein n=1 Tax=Stylosanthes scabra TaxID=79078 RepID=A0ABU6XE63_9FABA|nr:hypothetical protein [Stylosanthes scabra]